MSKVSVCDPSEAGKHASLWGNQRIELTARDVAELIMGKTLFLKGPEYTLFITFNPEEEQANG